MMHEGRLVAQGSIDDLALTCPEFQRLTSLQTQRTVTLPLREEHASVA
jgi:hypothetical protein